MEYDSLHKRKRTIQFASQREVIEKTPSRGFSIFSSVVSPFLLVSPEIHGLNLSDFNLLLHYITNRTMCQIGSYEHPKLTGGFHTIKKWITLQVSNLKYAIIIDR